MFGVVLLVGAVYVVQKEFRDLSLHDIRLAMGAIPASALWIAAGWTLLAYAVLTIYDRLGSVYAGRPISYFRTSIASFCAYSLSHNLGVPAVSGAAVRYRFYSQWGLTPGEIAKVVAFTSLTFGLGAFALGGAVLMLEPGVVPWLGEHLPHWAMRLVALLLWAIVAAYVTLSRLVPHFRLFGHQIDLPGFRLAVMQVVLAAVDVAVTAAIFWALLPHADGLTFTRFLGIYLASYSAGLASHAPGGIGVFDGAILLGLEPYMPAAEVIGALLVFRLFYYIIPLFIAGALFVGNELAQRRELVDWLLARLGRAPRAPTGTSDRVFEPTRGSEALEVPVLAGLVGLGGAVLIFIGALPPRSHATEGWAGHEVALASHFAASLVGTLLLVGAWGLLRRLRLAWGGSMIALVLGASIASLRGEPWWLVAAYATVLLLLAALRRSFYRDARLLAEPLSGESLFAFAALFGCAVTLALVAYGRRVAETSWWGVVFSPLAPDSLRFTVGLSVVMLILASVRLLRPVKLRPEPFSVESAARLRALGALVPARADGVVFGEDGEAGFAILKGEEVWLGLGDPAGAPRDRISAIWRFRDMCERAGVDAAFWRVGSELLRVYADIGLIAFPLAPPAASPPASPPNAAGATPPAAGGDPDGPVAGGAAEGATAGPGSGQGQGQGQGQARWGVAGPRYLVCRAERDLERLRPLLPC
nr:lysylphosphatidylglycerol synthase domain-containing protein [Roseomonas acroporae]